MTEDRFSKGLIATLAHRTPFIDVRDDRHQAALVHALAELRRLQDADEPGAASMPRSLRPGPITGKYDEFDDALLNLQDLGYVVAQNPYYTAVELSLRPERVKRVMGKFSEAERNVFDQVASVFLSNDLQQSA